MAFFANDSYLVIPDTHFPWEAEGCLQWLSNIKKIFKIPDDNIYHTGDLLDMYAFSMHPKGPDLPLTPNLEIEHCQKKILLWSKVFPKLKICMANHESRYWRKASLADIPSQVLRSLKEVFKYPTEWEIRDHWIVNGSKQKFMIQHGEGFSGKTGHMDAAMVNGMSTVIGHLHSFAGVNHIKTKGQSIWSCNAGALISADEYCFHYSKHSKFKVTNGALVVMDGGNCPMWLPYK